MPSSVQPIVHAAFGAVPLTPDKYTYLAISATNVGSDRGDLEIELESAYVFFGEPTPVHLSIDPFGRALIGVLVEVVLARGGGDLPAGAGTVGELTIAILRRSTGIWSEETKVPGIAYFPDEGPAPEALSGDTEDAVASNGLSRPEEPVASGD